MTSVAVPALPWPTLGAATCTSWPPSDEAGGEALGETRGAVHVGEEGVGADEDPQGAIGAGTASRAAEGSVDAAGSDGSAGVAGCGHEG